MDSIPNSEAKRPLCTPAIDVQEGGIHAMSRNSSSNTSTEKQNSITSAQQGCLSSEQHSALIDAACKDCAACYCCSNPTSRNLMRACIWMQAVPELMAAYLFASSLKKGTSLAAAVFFPRGWVVVALLLSVEINRVGTHYTACVA